MRQWTAVRPHYLKLKGASITGATAFILSDSKLGSDGLQALYTPVIEKASNVATLCCIYIEAQTGFARWKQLPDHLTSSPANSSQATGIRKFAMLYCRPHDCSNSLGRYIPVTHAQYCPLLGHTAQAACLPQHCSTSHQHTGLQIALC